MKRYFVLDVQVRTPVTDFCCATQLKDFQHRVVVGVMHDDRLLNRGQEFLICRRRDVVVRSVCDGCTGLGDRTSFLGECIQVLGGGV